MQTGTLPSATLSGPCCAAMRAHKDSLRAQIHNRTVTPQGGPRRRDTDERRLRALQKHLTTVKLLIVDELGYVPFAAVGSELLFEVFSQRYERASVGRTATAKTTIPNLLTFVQPRRAGATSIPLPCICIPMPILHCRSPHFCSGREPAYSSEPAAGRDSLPTAARLSEPQFPHPSALHPPSSTTRYVTCSR